MTRTALSLHALRAFEAAARLGSVRLAAEALYVTHGAVSRQLKHLESQLGVALWCKQGRGIKLTDAGTELYTQVAAAFAHLYAACDKVQLLQQSAPLVLGCPGSFLARWFIPRLERLQKELPELRLQLSVQDTEQRALNGLDALLCYAAPPWPTGIQVTPLVGEWIGPVLSPRHPRYKALYQASAEQLLTEALLHTQSRPQAWSDWLRLSGLAGQSLQLGQSFEHLYYLLEAAVAGLGVAIAPQQLVADDLRAERLVAPWGFVQSTACLGFWVPTAPVHPQAALLCTWLQAELTAEG